MRIENRTNDLCSRLSGILEVANEELHLGLSGVDLALFQANLYVYPDKVTAASGTLSITLTSTSIHKET